MTLETRLSPWLLAVLFWLPVAAHAQDTTTGAAQAAIEKTVVEVLEILRDGSKDAAGRRTSLETLAQDRFDFRTMSKLVLTRNWKRLSGEQQEEFVAEFTSYLSNDYGSRIERYNQEEVEVLGERQEPRGDVTVKTKIVGGENSGALVDYRMRKKGDKPWLIIDVVVEGISLVANFRDQFRDVMGSDGPAVLIDRLKEKNAQPAGA